MDRVQRSIRMFVVLSLLTGGVYPVLVTILGQGLFGEQASGSAVALNGVVRGSVLVGQNFVGPEFFHSRPSALATPYDATTSGGSNLGPSNPELLKQVSERVASVASMNGLSSVPVDLVTTSGSGLDPHISKRAALSQTARIAKERGMSTQEVAEIVELSSSEKWLGIFGEPRVNVLLANIELEKRRPTQNHGSHE